MTTAHPLQLSNILEVLSPTEHRWNCLILTQEDWVFDHNTAVLPSGAGIDSFGDFSAEAVQLSASDSLIQGSFSLQVWLEGLQ